MGLNGSERWERDNACGESPVGRCPSACYIVSRTNKPSQMSFPRFARIHSWCRQRDVRSSRKANIGTLVNSLRFSWKSSWDSEKYLKRHYSAVSPKSAYNADITAEGRREKKTTTTNEIQKLNREFARQNIQTNFYHPRTIWDGNNRPPRIDHAPIIPGQSFCQAHGYIVYYSENPGNFVANRRETNTENAIYIYFQEKLF